VTESLESRVARVTEQVAAAALHAGRSPEDVMIVAVSKTVDRNVVDAACDLGLRTFGENRVQDAARKFQTPLPPGAKLHMIGQLQSNKAPTAVRLFDMVESVDRPSLIAELEQQAAKLGQPLPVLLQVNIAGEAQKSGCEPESAESLIRLITQSFHLELQGLMTIAPLVSDVEDARPVFRGLRELRDRMQDTFPDESLDVLSMGMSNDYEIAIDEGATMVRIGRAIFEGS
jgi:pyridoxal phosphate enzyme (YggS family)